MARWKATDKSIPYLPSKKYLGPGDTRGSGENDVTAGSQQGRHIWFSSSVKLRFCCQYRHERWRVGKLVTRTFKFCPQKGNWGPRDTRLGGGLTSRRGLSRARYTNVVVYQTENLSLVIQTEAIARRKTGDEYVQLLPSSTHAARSTRGRSSVTVGSQQGRAGVVSNFRSFWNSMLILLIHIKTTAHWIAGDERNWLMPLQSSFDTKGMGVGGYGDVTT